MPSAPDAARLAAILERDREVWHTIIHHRQREATQAERDRHELVAALEAAPAPGPRYRPIPDEDMPTDREWTEYEWAMNQWYLANEAVADCAAPRADGALLQEAYDMLELLYPANAKPGDVAGEDLATTARRLRSLKARLLRALSAGGTE